jgi:glycosyltransferase involved in cell wall biosynthesis
VVLCTRDRPEFLADALLALASAIAPGDEVVVVDSASTDPRVAEVARAAGVRIVRCDRPGLSIARNAGIAATTAPIVAFTDDDCRPRSGWTAALRRPFADPIVGFVTGAVVADDTGGAVVTVLEGERREFAAETDPIGVGHGANMAFRRTALEGISSFDELLGAGAQFRAAEDHDAFWRLLAQGWTGAFEPDAVVEHRQWRSRRAALKLEYGYGLGAGAFVTKSLRADREGGMRLLRTRLWGNGIAQAGRALARGHRGAAAASVLKVAGVVVGLARAARLPVAAGRFSAAKAP